MAKKDLNNNSLCLIYKNIFNQEISDIELEQLKNQILQLVRLTLIK
jgi:hypothetical protein